MALNGIDISKWQKDINLSAVPSDFVIVKATQGTTYVNPYFTKKITEAMALNKLVGVYHYCSKGGAENEASFFVENIKPYLGKVMICIDWEGQDNPNFGNPAYVKALMDKVYALTNIKPIIYISKSVTRTTGMNAIAEKYELWAAQYLKNPPTTYTPTPWTDTKGFGPWKEPIIFQYSSKGRLNGYSGDLDLDIAYLTKEEWLKRCQVTKKETTPVTPSTQITSVNKKVTITATTLNIRKEPNTTSHIEGVLRNGSTVTIDKIENGMAHFSGWCSLKYLK